MIDRNMLMFANESFYVAFSSRDLDAMDDLWARHTEITCIHPGWPALEGREEVMTSWQTIMESENSPEVDIYNAHAYILGTAAFVVCYERVPGGVLVATNTFVEEAGRVRLVHHQATPCQNPPTPDSAPTENLQ